MKQKQNGTTEKKEQNPMRELWCDFDGVVVCNELHGINTSDITSEEFVALVTNAYENNPVTSQTVRKLISEYNREGSPVNIITGRKRSFLAALTEKILKNHDIKVDNIFYYPEENAYVMDDYYAWKASVIHDSLSNNPDINARVIDDDRGLLDHLQKHFHSSPLELTHYVFFKDGSEQVLQLTP